jgi:predicted ArsR family transcriptional regulator
MNPPRTNGSYTINPLRLEALMREGTGVSEAIDILKKESGALIENHEEGPPEDDNGYYDYEKAEEEYRRSQPGRMDPRYRPLAKALPDRPNPDVRTRSVFSNRTSILVPEKAVFPKIRFLCKQLGLAAGPPTLLIGISQSGKTFLAQDLGLSVATGKPFLGNLSVGKGQVVHIDYEQGLEQSRVRYLRLMKGKGLTPSDLVDGDLDLYRAAKKLDEPGAEDELCEKLAGKALCIIDSLRASISGERDENASDFREPIDMLGRVSENTGCCILILHHQGKGTVRDDRFAGRGSSAIFEAAGSAFSLDVAGDYPKRIYHLWQTKTRMGRAPDVFYQLQDVGSEVEEIGCTEGIALVPSTAQVERTLDERIVDAVREAGELTAEALAKVVGGRKQEVLHARDKLVETGVLDHKARSSGTGKVYVLAKGWGDGSDDP